MPDPTRSGAQAGRGTTSAGLSLRPSDRFAAYLNSLFIDHAVFRAAWRNWAAVERGRLYRSNHPLPWQLRAAVRQFGLRTVINLRGNRADCGSDRLSREAASALGLTIIDAPFESRGAPHRDRILRLGKLYGGMAEPALIHCKSGADRTGLAAGIWLLLQGRTPDAALRQLSLRFGHVRQSRTGILDTFFVRYAEALRDRPALGFLDWVRDHYDELELRRDFHSAAWADRLVDRVLRRE
jgi:protein tyrosine phosphatase (PTP) superfamily phosphohydrolase (DUF442 family)